MLDKLKLFIDQHAWKSFPVMILKKPLGIKLSGHALIPLLGFINFISSRKLFKPTKVLLIMFAFGLIPTLLHANAHSLIRYVQFLGIILFFQAIQEIITKERVLKISQWIFYIACFVHASEAIFIGPRSIKGWFVTTLPRYNGVIGEPNFSGALLMGIFIFFLLQRKYWHSLVSFILIFSTGGRTAVLLSITLFIAHFIVKKFKLAAKIPAIILTVLLIATPLLGAKLTALYSDSPATYANLDRILSKRVTITRAYTKVFQNNLMGIGYFNGVKEVQKIAEKEEIDHVSEQHNLYLQILVELGPFAYLTFAFLIFSIYRRLQPIQQNALGFLLIYFYFFNGLHELILYFSLHAVTLLPDEELSTKDI